MKIKEFVILSVFLLFSCLTYSQSPPCNLGLEPEEEMGICGMEGVEFDYTPPADLINPTLNPVDYVFPIHVIYVQSSSGEFPTGVDSDNYRSEAAYQIAYANLVFPPNIQFELCEVSVIQDDNQEENFHFLGSEAGFQTIYGLVSEEEAIRVYVVESVNGGLNRGISRYPDSQYPSNVIIGNFFGSGSRKILPHELGHFFGLLHTFNNPLTPPGDDSGGDEISDTNNDPGIDDCDCDCDVITCLKDIFFPIPTPHWEEFTFIPPKQNIMSYYYCEPLSFSEGQIEKMTDIISDHPNRAFLTDETEPACQTFTGLEVATGGEVNYPRFNTSTNMLEYLPFPNIKLDFTSEDVDEDDLFWSVNTDQIGSYNPNDCDFIFNNINQKIIFGPAQGQLDYTEGNFDPLKGINTKDIIQLRKYQLGLIDLNPYAIIAGDTDNNGEINTYDLVLISKLILGINEGFLGENIWRFFPLFAIESNTEFANEFEADPFSAEWVIQYDENQGVLDSRIYKFQAADPDNNIEEKLSYFNNPFDLLMTNPLVLTNPTWQWRGIKTGDVNQSANLNFYPEIEIDYNLEYLEHNCIESGQTFSIAIIGTEDILLEGYQLAFDINKNLVDLEGISQGELPLFSLDNFSLEKSPDQLILKSLWYNRDFSEQSLKGGKTLFELNFKAKSNICDFSEIIDLFEDDIFRCEVYKNGTLETPLDLSVKVNSSVRKHHLTQVYPNPMGSEIGFDFELDNQANVKIEIIDASGNFLTHENLYPTGEHNFSIVDLSSLQSGILHYSVELENELNTGIIIKF